MDIGSGAVMVSCVSQPETVDRPTSPGPTKTTVLEPSSEQSSRVTRTHHIQSARDRVECFALETRVDTVTASLAGHASREHDSPSADASVSHQSVSLSTARTRREKAHVDGRYSLEECER